MLHFIHQLVTHLVCELFCIQSEFNSGEWNIQHVSVHNPLFFYKTHNFSLTPVFNLIHIELKQSVS